MHPLFFVYCAQILFSAMSFKLGLYNPIPFLIFAHIKKIRYEKIHPSTFDCNRRSPHYFDGQCGIGF